jgi:DNA ligase-associated metallophosphoesterase
MRMFFGGEEFVLHPSGALYWPSEKILVVSDLHLEKGSHFALRGFFLPPYDSRHTLSLLSRVCEETGCARIILLGDSFHDEKGYHRLGVEDRNAFDALKRLNPIWIKGNHDKDFVPADFSGMSDYMHGGIVFRHEAGGHGFEISGHYHPKVEIRTGFSRLARPCFVEDGQRMIMPSFGAYTGGLSIGEAAFAKILSDERRVYALGRDKVYTVMI